MIYPSAVTVDRPRLFYRLCRINSKKNESGNSILEFALCLPLLATFLLGIIQFGLIFAAQMTLQNAAMIAARFSTLSDPLPTEAQILEVARGALLPMLPPEHLQDSAIDLDEVVGGVAGARKIALSYELPLYFAFVVPGASDNNTYPLRASVVMR